MPRALQITSPNPESKAYKSDNFLLTPVIVTDTATANFAVGAANVHEKACHGFLLSECAQPIYPGTTLLSISPLSMTLAFFGRTFAPSSGYLYRFGVFQDPKNSGGAAFVR